VNAEIWIQNGAVEVTGILNGADELVRFTEQMMCLASLADLGMIPELQQPTSKRIKWALTMDDLPAIPA